MENRQDNAPGQQEISSCGGNTQRGCAGCASCGLNGAQSTAAPACPAVKQGCPGCAGGCPMVQDTAEGAWCYEETVLICADDVEE